jgi:hypothetical protein
MTRLSRKRRPLGPRSLAVAALWAALSTIGCVPFLEAGTAGVMTFGTPGLGAGSRSAVGFGIQKKEGLGTIIRAEAGGGYDSAAGTAWVARLGAGYTIPLDSRDVIKWELFADTGTRINGGLFARDIAVGARTAIVIPFSRMRRLYDANESFVFIGRSIEGLVGLRYGHMFYFEGGGQDEVGLGLTLRVRAWSDIF